MDAIILAGGGGRRMNGVRKAFLRLQGETFIERILRVVGPLVDAVLVTANEPELYAHLPVRVVPDERPGLGPLMGIYSGLRASGAELAFVTAVDTPLLVEPLVRRLLSPGRECDAFVPRRAGKAEPLCAVYARRCLPAMEKVMGEGSVSPDGGPSAGRIIAFYPHVRVCWLEEPEVRSLDPAGTSFLNVNTQADYDALVARDR